MVTITFEEGQKYIAGYGLSKEGEYTPIFMIKNGVKHFVKNLVKVTKYADAYDKIDYESNVKSIEKYKEQLKNNNGCYVTFYGKCDDPFEFINWVKENNYTFEIHGELFYECDGHVDFHGNLCEYSAAFHYRIYDEDIISKLKEEVSKCKTYVFYERNKAIN